jgi:catechol 2,3-dioxygenase-like lactoylglutathione lyase family enzyme
VEAFWRAGTDGGYASDGEPGRLRRQYHADYYGAFLLDPDGNSVEAVYDGRARQGYNVIDHLWIRVSDLDASKRFYERVAPVLGLRIANVLPERFHVAARDRPFALVGGEPSVNVHLAFPVSDRATVGDFHRTAVAAGYRDNGAPGERRGWGAYFRYGNSTQQFSALDVYVFERLSRFLSRKHGSSGRGAGMNTLIESQAKLGIYRLAGTVRNDWAHAAR